MSDPSTKNPAPTPGLGDDDETDHTSVSPAPSFGDDDDDHTVAAPAPDFGDDDKDDATQVSPFRPPGKK